MLRRALIAALTLAALLTLVVTYRALVTTRAVETLPPTSLLALDVDSAAKKLAGAIALPTLWKGTDTATTTFQQLHTHLARSFPRTHQTLRVETIEGFSLLYTWQGSDRSKKPILLMAHQDVVPIAPGTEEDWTHPPFSGAISDGFVWGRGALDIKSALVAELEAIETLIAAGFVPKRTVYLAFGHDEEVGGTGAAAIARALAERGVRLELVLDEGSSMVEGLIPGVKEPVAVIGIAEKGYVSLELSVRAEGGHSSMPPPHTAVGILSQAVTRLEANPFPSKRTYAGKFFRELAPAMPFHLRLVFTNLWLFGPIVEPILAKTKPMNAAIRTTTAVTMFQAGVKDNVLPQEARAVVNFRIIPGETITTTIEHVESTIANPDVEVRQLTKGSIGNDPSAVSDTNSEAYRRLRTTIRQVTGNGGFVVAPYLVLGATDSRHYAKVSDATFRFVMNLAGPEDLPRIHGTNERVAVKSLEDMIRFYAQLIRGFD
ncbi:MAG: M20 family peptidase [Deltaproteobacteria bacterium]|nr:M20 family peptidase [Deltaproteobacteria bacterium]